MLDVRGVLEHPREAEQGWAQVLQALQQSESIQASSAESWCRHQQTLLIPALCNLKWAGLLQD